MTKKPTTDDVRKQCSDQLFYLQQFLGQLPQVKGTSAISDAARQCKAERPDGDDDKWGYEIRGVRFESEPGAWRHILPPAATNVLVELGASVTGNCFPVDDPLSSLAMQIVLSADYRDKDGPVPLMFSWHLDRHTGDDEPAFLHPRYHFQHAGRVMRESGHGWGHAVFVEPPRIMHPPMDAILSADYVLANFLPNARAKLRRNGNYRKLVRGAQAAFWRPYVVALAEAWSEGSKSNTCFDFWPYLMPRVIK